jgi:transcriptional regulator with XRE-family HTH domain
MSLTSAQCRAARALLGWSQDQLAAASEVAKATIANFEAEKRAPYPRTLTDLQSALESAGVIFVEENGDGPGVRLKKQRRYHPVDDGAPKPKPVSTRPVGKSRRRG